MQDRQSVPDVIVITGMSGAGRTETMHVFEDLGYYVIDNLPPKLILTLANIVGINSGVGRHLAIVCDLRSQGLFDELLDELDEDEESSLLPQATVKASATVNIKTTASVIRDLNPLKFECFVIKPPY